MSQIAVVLRIVSSILLGSAVEARAQTDGRSYDRIRAGLQHGALAGPTISTALQRVLLFSDALHAAPRTTARTPSRRAARANGGDSVWNGLLIGAAIGAGSGYVWARKQCGPNDPECFAITCPIGVLGGAGIGAAVGAVLDALAK